VVCRRHEMECLLWLLLLGNMSTLIRVRKSENTLLGCLLGLRLQSIMFSEVIHGRNLSEIVGTLIGLCMEARILLSSLVPRLMLLKLVISY
jgi:hypothetical protein